MKCNIISAVNSNCLRKRNLDLAFKGVNDIDPSKTIISTRDCSLFECNQKQVFYRKYNSNGQLLNETTKLFIRGCEQQIPKSSLSYTYFDNGKVRSETEKKNEDYFHKKEYFEDGHLKKETEHKSDSSKIVKKILEYKKIAKDNYKRIVDSEETYFFYNEVREFIDNITGKIRKIKK